MTSTLDTILQKARKLQAARERATTGKWTDYPAADIAGRAIIAPQGPAVFPDCWDVKLQDSAFTALAANETAYLCDAIEHLAARVKVAEDALEWISNGELSLDERRNKDFLIITIEDVLCPRAEDAITAARQLEHAFAVKWAKEEGT